jgi:hypothetical protein
MSIEERQQGITHNSEIHEHLLNHDRHAINYIRLNLADKRRGTLQVHR